MNTIFRDNLQMLKDSVNTMEEKHIEPALRCIEMTKETVVSGGKIILCGNGGSSANAAHIANDFIGHMNNWERRGYPAICLTDNISTLTALTNDYGYDLAFQKQIEALGKEGDIFWTFSTSGNSENIVRAVTAAKKMGIKTVAFTNSEGGKLKDLVDCWIGMNTRHAMLAEALHLFYIHSIAEAVEFDIDPVAK